MFQWTHQRPWDVATFCFRSPLTVKATDSDEDPDGSAGDSTFEDETGELDEKDEKDELDEKDAEGDGDKTDEDDGKPKRFASHEAAEDGYLELHSHTSRLEQENQALRQQMAAKETRAEPDERRAPEEFNEAALANAIAQAVDAEISALPKEKQNLQATTGAIVREVLKVVKPMAEQVADRAAVTRSHQAMTQEQIRASATVNATKALAEVGLTKPEHMRLLVMERDRRRDEDPQGWNAWTSTTTPAEQFKELAKGVLTFIKTLGGATSDEVKEANRKHREDADTLDGGTRRSTRPSTKQDSDDGENEGGSMLDALRADRKGAFDRSKRVSQFASATRR